MPNVQVKVCFYSRHKVYFLYPHPLIANLSFWGLDIIQAKMSALVILLFLLFVYLSIFCKACKQLPRSFVFLKNIHANLQYSKKYPHRLEDNEMGNLICFQWLLVQENKEFYFGSILFSMWRQWNTHTHSINSK